MLEFLINALNVKTVTALFAGLAAAATVLTLAMPFVFVDPLDKRMRAVALEREKIRQRERERLAQEGQKAKLRQTPKQYIQTIVDRFNLTKWVGQEEARLKLIQAGYRGQAPYVTYLFFRMLTPVACFLFSLLNLFVILKLDQPAMVIFRQFQPAEHVVLRLARSRLADLVRGLGRVARDETVGLEGLELDRIRAGLGGDVNELQRPVEVTVVIYAGFRNDEAGRAGADGSFADEDVRVRHAWSSMTSLTR